MAPEISVIIPCLNEAETIGVAISSVTNELNTSGVSFEIIVVDNGSTDGSDVIAKNYNIIHFYSDAYPVAAVRNFAVNNSKGKVLIFLDADIVVQEGWGVIVNSICASMMEDDNFITGSQPQVPDNIQPLLYAWYKALSEDVRDTHLGTGHMIVSRKTFNKVGGFDQSLITNEDFYFCYEAKKIGITVVSDPAMKVFHLGYPNTLIDFAKREIWHGLGDCNNLNRLLRSRVAWCGAIFLLLNLIMLPSLLVKVKMFAVIPFVVIFMAAAFNLVKFGYGNIGDFVYRSLVSYVYLLSRGLALPAYFIQKNKFSHWAHRKNEND